MQFLKKLLPFHNVVADGVATIDFANLKGYAVDAILLVLSGTAFTKSMITDIDIKVNSKTVFKDSGGRVDSLNQYRGETADAAYLVIPFDESRGRTEVKNTAKGLRVVDGLRVGSIDTTFGVQDMTGEITIAGATAPALAGYALLSPPSQMDPQFAGLIGKHFNFTLSPAASGTFDFKVPQGDAKGALVKRVSLHGSTVTGFEVKRNGISVRKSDAVADSNFLQTRFGRTPQTNIAVIDFIEDGDQSGAFSQSDADSTEWSLTVSGAGNVVVVPELYDILNNN